MPPSRLASLFGTDPTECANATFPDVWGTIPDEVIQADRAHHAVLKRVHFSRHLNPTNVHTARKAFTAGAPEPPFTYRPLANADEVIEHLQKALPSTDHPAGALIARCMEGTCHMTRALRDRSSEAFEDMAQHAGWLPDAALLELDFANQRPGPHQPLDVSPQRMIAALKGALLERGFDDWEVLADSVMAARVLVDSAKRLVKVGPRARFRQRDLIRLVVHEIDVHATRAHNGRQQALHCFSTGLPGALATEEGLAMVAEEVAGVSSPGVLQRQKHVVWAVDRAREVGFRQLFEELRTRAGRGLAWGICLRVKRGLAEPGAPGVYAKDTVYLAGRMKVRAWLDDGNDVANLYVGKVGVEDPVQAWIAEGWVKPRPVPALWAALGEDQLTPPGPALASRGTLP